MHIRSERCICAFYKNPNLVQNTMSCILTVEKKLNKTKVHWMHRPIHFTLHKSHDNANEK